MSLILVIQILWAPTLAPQKWVVRTKQADWFYKYLVDEGLHIACMIFM